MPSTPAPLLPGSSGSATAAPAALAALFGALAAGQPPVPDGSVTVLPRAPGRAVAAVLGFTAHHVVAADVDPNWVHATIPADSFSARMGPAFLTALARQVGAEPGGQDVLLLAPSSGASPGPSAGPPAVPDGQPPTEPLEPVTDLLHPRLDRANRYRSEVRAYRGEGALVVLGRGLAGRWEVAIEVDPARRGHGYGRRLATAARWLVPAGAALWAQVHPANVASLRAFLAAGYRPVGAEVLLT